MPRRWLGLTLPGMTYRWPALALSVMPDYWLALTLPRMPYR
jgi:hypothetical protein